MKEEQKLLTAGAVDAVDGAKISAIKLLRMVWPDLGTGDVKALTPEDRVQLASGIARNMGLAADVLAFVPVEY